jgi:polyhydroxybutyrate depolymerase
MWHRPQTPRHSLAIVGAAAVLISHAASAQTSLRQACAPDYHRFCEGMIPGTPAIRACFAANFARLAPGCQQAIAAAHKAADARRGADSGDTVRQVTVDGVPRTYLVHVPPQKPAAGFPVVLAFHGAGAQGAGMIGLTHIDALADRRGFIAVYPDGIDRRWDDGRRSIAAHTNDVAFTVAMLDDLAHAYPVDARRVFAAGMSNGAMLSERLGCELSARIGAIAAVAGGMAADIAPSCHPAKPVSVLQIAGTADPVMPYGGGIVANHSVFGVGGEVVGAARTAELWAHIDGCGSAGAPAALPPVPPADGTSVTRTHYAGCAAGREVSLLTVTGGGHAWPGGPQYLPALLIGPASTQLDASNTIIDFFLAQPPR